jgi:excisionase family DNA binding protein
LAYSIPEAVAISGIGRTLLYAEIGAGRLDAVKAGRRTLIPRTALERFISTLPSATENGFIRLTNKTVKGHR